jgi:hypothetical protein
MERFRRNFRDILAGTATPRTLLIAAVIIAVLFATLVVAYSAFDLGTVLPRRHL